MCAAGEPQDSDRGGPNRCDGGFDLNDVAEINADPDVRLVVRTAPRPATPPTSSRSGPTSTCHRADNGGYTPTERLEVLRAVFFDRPGWSLGEHPRRLAVQRRPYMENARWWQPPVELATLQVVGSRPGRRRPVLH